ncbi:hypothetical protein [Pedobacter sp. SG918]|uniref:hypothetical protein n=1 Tax=Pedobacter sp. SG918 TaxID=2587136 RepID=UPI00146ECF64|nr:hypothetical protein [Pedobacter sp. SG918]
MTICIGRKMITGVSSILYLPFYRLYDHYLSVITYRVNGLAGNGKGFGNEWCCTFRATQPRHSLQSFCYCYPEPIEGATKRIFADVGFS